MAYGSNSVVTMLRRGLATSNPYRRPKSQLDSQPGLGSVVPTVVCKVTASSILLAMPAM